ncbi:MAG: glycosyltransferase [Phycisphaerales bacterium]|nr:glycosyltransferase [Phycisphaerales bacterium]
MPTLLMDILIVLLTVLSVFSLIYWSTVSGFIVSAHKQFPTARDGIELAEHSPPTAHVCVVVPAHNEAGNIATLIESLRAQDYDRLRIVLALDRCTDDTAGVARQAIDDDHRFEVIEIVQCPEDWAGKVHAAHQGFTQSKHAASSDMVLFTDADTWFDPSCVRAAVALAQDRGLDLLSLLSTLGTDSWFERVVQPYAGFELARQFPLTKVNRKYNDRQRAFANGQFMLFRTKSYTAIGGHEGVKGAILEDLAFASETLDAKMQSGVLLADDMLRCRMYDSWEEFVRGWKRIYTESTNREIRRLRKYALRAPLTGFVYPVGSLVCVGAGIVWGDPSMQFINIGLGTLGFMAWLVTMVLVARASHARVRDIWSSVIGAVLVGRIFQIALSDLRSGVQTQWGGKSYTRIAAEDEIAQTDADSKNQAGAA